MRTLLSIRGVLLALLVSLPLFVQAETLEIGGIYGLTGALPSVGEEVLNGALLAQEKAGNVSVIPEDSRWETKAAVAAFQKLLTLGSVNVVHVTGAPMTLAIKPLSERAGIVLFSLAAHPAILKGSRFVIRHGNRADADAKILADAIAERRPQRVASISLQNEWAQSFDEHLKLSLEGGGIQTMFLTHLPDETDLKGHVIKALSFKPDIVVTNSFGGPLGRLILGLRELGFKGPIYSNNGLSLSPDASNLIRRSGLAGELYYQSYAEPSEKFRKLYSKRFSKEPGAMALISYCDIELLSFAARKSGSDPESLVSYIKKLGNFEGEFAKLEIGPDGDILEPLFVRHF